MDKKKPKDLKEETDDGEGGDGGQGDQSGSSGSGGYIPSYYDLIGISVDQAQIAALAEQALREIRLAVKAKGYDVEAFNRNRERSQAQNENLNINTNEAGMGLGLLEHPELDMDGALDPNTIVIPKSVEEALASNDLDFKLRMLAEYKQRMALKMRLHPDNVPTPAPRIRPTSTPRPRPY